MLAYQKNLSLKRVYSLYDYAKRVSQIAIDEEPEVLYVLLPANSLAKFTSEVKKKCEGILIYDILDMWPESLPFRLGKAFWPFSVWRKMRDNNLKKADLVVTECGVFSEMLKKNLGYTPQTVYWPKDIKKPKWMKVPDLDLIHICYLGTVNHIIDIETIVSIMERLNRKKKVICHIIGKGENKTQFIRALEKAGIEVIDEGVIYDGDVKGSIIQQCHYGLNIMKPEVCVGLTMKSVEYFAYGLPILNNILGDTWRLVEEEKVGFNCYPSMNDEQINNMIHLAEDTVKMRAHIRHVYEEKFSVPAFYIQMEKAWSQLEIQRGIEK